MPVQLNSPAVGLPSVSGDGGGAILGPYANATALEAAKPAASNPGAQALVGSTAPYQVFAAVAGAWVATGVSGGAVSAASITDSSASGRSVLTGTPAQGRTALELGSAATQESSAFATAAQGAKADTAVQPGALAAVATSGAYSDLSGRPTLGTAAATDVAAYATAAQGAKADTAVQPGALALVATSGAYADLSGKPDISAAADARIAAASISALADVDTTGVTSGQVLKWNGSAWVPGTDETAAGGATNLGATASPTGVTVTSDTGTDATLPLADGTNAGLMAPAQHTKLAGIAAGATANATDAQLRDRATHTGTQTAATISDFGAAARAAASSVVGSQLIVGLGDSLTAQGVAFNAGAPAYSVNSGLNWGCALLGQSVWMPFGFSSAWTSGPADIVNYCLAVSGVTTVTVLADQVPAAQALASGWWSVLAGTNDLTLLAGDSAATICGRIRQIVEAGLTTGRNVALWTIPPRSQAAWNSLNASIAAAGSTIAAQRAKHMAVNAWIRRYAQETAGVVLIDPYNDLVDPASAEGDWRSGCSLDGTHWSNMGAFIGGWAFARAMATHVKPISGASIGQPDVYDATNNPGGNLLPVAAFTMQGTGGAIGGTGVSGTVPTGWTQDLEAGTLTPGTATLAAQSRSDPPAGGREVQCTLAGSAPGNFTLRFYQAAATIPANSLFFAEVAVSVTLTAGGLRTIELLSFNQSGSPSVFPSCFAPDSTVIPAGVAFNAVLRTPICRSSGAVNHVLMTRVNGVAGTAGTVRIQRVAIRRIDTSAPGLILGA